MEHCNAGEAGAEALEGSASATLPGPALVVLGMVKESVEGAASRQKFLDPLRVFFGAALQRLLHAF
jgi:hypothetical protein